MLILMLVPNRILGGMLAALLGLTPGLAAFAETSALPGNSVLVSTPADQITAALPVIALSSSVAPAAGPTAVSVVAQIGALDLSGRLPRPEARSEEVIRVGMAYPGGVLIRPMAREDFLPRARWDDRAGTQAWTRAAMKAINNQRHDLSDIVPVDIASWCPAYVRNGEVRRDAFWIGMMSALARHESMFNPGAVGGGGLYYGLFQILPSTARHYRCEATTGQELRDPEANLACAIRIMSATVARDDAVSYYDGRWRGVAADWGPMTNSDKRADMQDWTRAQNYCAVPTAVTVSLRPLSRPGGDSDLVSLPEVFLTATLSVPALRPALRPEDAELRPE
jgi:hypothetical protein